MLLSAIRRCRFLAGVVVYLSLSFAASAQAVHASADSHPAYRIAGTVVSKLDGTSLARTRVFLRDSRNREELRSVVTSEDGKFAFDDVPAGKYALVGSKRGFISAAFDQHDQFATAIVTGAGLGTENLVLKLSPAASIEGTVLDESGDPVRHALVTLYRNDHFQGVEQIHGAGNAQTDDLGAYEITGLMPGTYYVAASANPWYAVHPATGADQTNSPEANASTANFDPTLDVAYPVTYYPDATDSERATPIQFHGGERQRIDFRVAPVPALRLLVRVPGDTSHGWSAPMLEQPVFDGLTYVQTSATMVSPGTYEVSGVPAGRYNIRIRAQDVNLEMSDVEFSKDGEQIDTSTAEPLSNVKISVQIAGQNTFPPGTAVGLRTRSSSRATWYAVDPKGNTEAQPIAAGKYDVQMVGVDKLYSISSMSADGAQVSGHTATIAAGTTASISLTAVATGTVEIQGTAKRSSKGIAGAMVVLVPKDPESNRDLFRRDQSDLDGTFSLRQVAPGSYTLVAIEDGWDLDWSRAEVIAPYLKRGRPIEVRGEISSPVRVKEPIEVQKK